MLGHPACAEESVVGRGKEARSLLLAVPLAAEAQRAAGIARIGYLAADKLSE
jgi:hypothetical protein